MKWLKRLFRRVRFIFDVAHTLGADLPSKVKMVAGGIWLLINDSWKSRLRFTAQICLDGRSCPFFFEDAGDFELLDEVFLKGSYYFSQLAGDRPVIFDIGANIGVSTLFFALKWPGATICSVEPDPENFRRLKQITSVLPNISLYNLAVWSEISEIPFYRNVKRGSSSSVLSTGNHKEKIFIATITLSELMEQTGTKQVSLLKFDVEGAEEKVFSGFTQFQNIEQLAGELHHDLCNTSGLVETLKKKYNKIEFHPLKEKREYVIATRE
ncbi:MAG: FkbM family methyltransferase [Balneolaceae bacterium]|nr:MAG: FkbM family methyltransferase [Balneolaceae bacterium]